MSLLLLHLSPPPNIGPSACKPKSTSDYKAPSSFPCFEFFVLFCFKAQLPVNELNAIMAKLTNNSQWTNTIHYTLKMTSDQVTEK